MNLLRRRLLRPYSCASVAQLRMMHWGDGDRAGVVNRPGNPSRGPVPAPVTARDGRVSLRMVRSGSPPEAAQETVAIQKTTAPPAKATRRVRRPMRAQPGRAVGVARARRTWKRSWPAPTRTPPRWSAPPTSAPDARTTPPPGSRRGAGRWPDRLPLPRAVHGPLDRPLHPHGRRGRELDRRIALQQAQPRLPEHRGRDLLPFGTALDPGRHRGGRQRHLQDPLQRRGGDDRRPADGRPPHGAGHHPADAGRGRAPHRGGDRRAGEVRGAVGPCPWNRGLPPARAGRGAADVARGRRGHRHRLRPDLRGGEAPPAQAREVPRPAPARVHQPRGLRGMRGLRGEVELRRGGAGGDRVRAQARHRPVVVQQGLLLRRGVLPELRHRARWPPAQGRRRLARGRPAARAAGTPASRSGPALRDHRHRGGGRRGHHHRRAAGDGRPSGIAGMLGARPDRACAEGRGGGEPRADRGPARRRHHHAGRQRGGGPGARLRHGGHRGRGHPRDDAGREDRRGGEFARDDDRRLHPRRGPPLPG